MARKSYGRRANLVQVAGSGTTYPDDGSSPVGSGEWNANHDDSGILGFDKSAQAISGNNNIAVTDSFLEITTADASSGGSNDGIYTLSAVTTALSSDYYVADTNNSNVKLRSNASSFSEGDLLYVVKAAGQGTTTLKHQQGGAGAGKITTLSGSDKALSATVPTILMARIISGNVEWVEYGGGTANNLTVSNLAAGTLVVASETIASNDNDTTIPTCAAVLDLVQTEDTISELNDTTITGPASNDLLQWNGSAWVDRTYAEAGVVSTTVADGNILVGNGSNVATSVNPSGDIDISNAGVFSITADSVINADVKTDAAIAYSKLAALTSAQILVGNGSNVATSVAVTGDVTISNAGVTNIANNAVGLPELASGTDGELITWDASGDPAAVPVGTAGHVLTSGGNGVAPTFQAAAGGGATLFHLFSNSTTTSYAGQSGEAQTLGTAVGSLASGSGDRDIYIRKVDTNNEGVFAVIHKNGSLVEVQVA